MYFGKMTVDNMACCLFWSITSRHNFSKKNFFFFISIFFLIAHSCLIKKKSCFLCKPGKSFVRAILVFFTIKKLKQNQSFSRPLLPNWILLAINILHKKTKSFERRLHSRPLRRFRRQKTQGTAWVDVPTLTPKVIQQLIGLITNVPALSKEPR